MAPAAAAGAGPGTRVGSLWLLAAPAWPAPDRGRLVGLRTGGLLGGCVGVNGPFRGYRRSAGRLGAASDDQHGRPEDAHDDDADSHRTFDREVFHPEVLH